jgi:hypothetical protein
MFFSFFLFLLDDRRIRIRSRINTSDWIRIHEAQKHVDPDPEHCQNIWILRIRIRIRDTAGQEHTSVLHLLWNLVRVEHAGNGDVHLPLLVLSGAQGRVSLLQVQVTVVFA